MDNIDKSDVNTERILISYNVNSNNLPIFATKNAATLN